uniref:Uncharacterized protein n=1 Tax=uncultured alpha proteobacterium HF0010_13E22 TaxID=710801 RepID=E0XQY8_9PROT|nr:hypothetical protein [uncultured alpha proteobacterium HF0010_13E22]
MWGQGLNLRPSGHESDIFSFQPTVFPKGTRILGTSKKASEFFGLPQKRISKPDF